MFRLNLKILKKAYKCVSNDEARPYINGVHIKYDEEAKTITYEATDGHILYKAIEKETADYGEELSMREAEFLTEGIILNCDFSKIKVGYSGAIDCELINEKNIIAENTANNRFLICIIQSDYPNMDKAIPRKNKKTINHCDCFKAFNWKYLKIKEELGFGDWNFCCEDSKDQVRFDREEFGLQEILVIMPISLV